MCTSPLLMHYNTKEHKYQINDSRDCDPMRMIWVACGKCPDCKKARKSNYTVRARAEFQKYGPQRTFLLNLTVNKFCMDKVFPGGSLDHTEFQKFMKRLRKKLEMNDIDVKIKYICGAEYGEDNGRPHFHVIVYGWKPNDLKAWTKSQKNFKQYRSQFIEECWRDVDSDFDYDKIEKFKEEYKGMRQANGEEYDYLPLGMVTLGEVYDSTAAYVSKYVVKNCDVSKENYSELNEGKRKPYIVFPREMLGYEWFLDNYKQILKLGYSTTKYGKCAVPKNWLNKFREVAENTENTAYLAALDEFDNNRKAFFSEMYKEMIANGFKTKIQMYEEIMRQGYERLQTYHNQNIKFGLTYL